jgi:putative RNA 2'-phosphotransferase
VISNYTSLSKKVSYALRHAPQEYGLTLDAQGWVPIEDLIDALKKREKYADLTFQDIAGMIQASEKKRHQLVDNRIRALYGHSTEEKIKKDAVQPPDVLYHGTAHKFLDKILEQGLISKSRQYVHLSQDRETAITVGKRRDNNPVVLRIDAVTAWKNGIKFYHGNETIWLADDIPAKYITLS